MRPMRLLRPIRIEQDRKKEAYSKTSSVEPSLATPLGHRNLPAVSPRVRQSSGTATTSNFRAEMEVRIQNLTRSSKLQVPGGSNCKVPQLSWRPCCIQDNRLVQLPKTSMLWVNSLAKPLVVGASNKSGLYSADISVHMAL
jgi:hypothetical protein